MIRSISTFCLILSLSGCGMLSTKLSDDHVTRYIAAFTALKTVAPEAARDLKGGGASLETLRANKAAFEKIQAEVKKAGFADFQDFMKTHASINLAFVHLEASGSMEKFGETKNTGLEMLDRQIADPGTPAEVREALKKQRDEIAATAAKNEAIAGKVMGVLDKVADPENLKVVERHRSTLKALYLNL